LCSFSVVEEVDTYELVGRDISFEDDIILVFFDNELLLFDVYKPLIIRLEDDVDRPIEASLFNELERDDVENTDFINPFMFVFLSLEL
jgi:hypothetical protein